jgi:hypothetical protein
MMKRMLLVQKGGLESEADSWELGMSPLAHCFEGESVDALRSGMSFAAKIGRIKGVVLIIRLDRNLANTLVKLVRKIAQNITFL